MKTENKVEVYRKEGSRLYKLNEEGRAYEFCYQNARLSSKAALIRAYESCEAACDDSDQDYD